MKEKHFEHMLKGIVKARGGEYLKLQNASWPDRIITFPHLPPIYIEIKKDGTKYDASNKQRRQLNRLQDLGYQAHLIDANDGGRAKLVAIIDGVLNGQDISDWQW